MRKSKDPIADGQAAINIAALALAKGAVQGELRAKGVRVTLVSPAEITQKAKQYLVDHPELYLYAFNRACKMGQIDQSVKDALKEQCWKRQPEKIYVFPEELHWNSWFWQGRADWRDQYKQTKEENKTKPEDKPKSIAIYSLAIVGMSVVGLTYWLMS
jgi:hypothetical protein